MHQFLARRIHLTEHRTGELIFASVGERYAEIVADSGINALRRNGKKRAMKTNLPP
jgi:putative membrane protein